MKSILLVLTIGTCLSNALISTMAQAATAQTDTPKSSPSGKPLVTLDATQVTATLDEARNGLSPETGSSQYVIDHKAIAQLPLGDSTPLNQVVLQAPGVVQDSFGQLHVRGDHANLQYRINGVMLPESISGFGQTLDARAIGSMKLLDGALPAQYGDRTAAVVDITTKSGHELGNGGDVGITGGSFNTLNPHASLWGSAQRWSWFLTSNYLRSDIGIENPSANRKPIHDHTNQLKSFGNVSYLVSDDARLSLLFGTANNRFEIPNRAGQQPQFQYLDQTDFNSISLNERQKEDTRFGNISLQGKLASTDYQISIGQRYSAVTFSPDFIGDLMFDGVASRVNQVDHATTTQADFSTPLGENNVLRYGIYAKHDTASRTNNLAVFPADANGNQTATIALPIDSRNRNVAKTLGAYVQNEWFIGDDWTINYGVRADRYQAFGASASQLSPRLGVVWQATADTTVHAGYARYFTPPSTELISSQDIALFDGTTNQVKNYGNNTPLPERSHYYDVGASQRIGNHFTLGLDGYYRQVRNLQDEGQFGAALIYSTFNYQYGRVRGAELTASYNNAPWNAYFNLARSQAMGKRVITSQYNFDPNDLAYIFDHWIFLDHDQKLASSGGLNFTFDDDTRIGADYLYGSGLRRDGLVPNGATLPGYFQLNLSVAHDFNVGGKNPLHTQLAIINVLDHSYQLRDGTGIGVGAPQFGPRRGLYLSVSKDF